MVYKELWLGWWIRLHKTKRLHRFNFGLHWGAFRLHEADERFTTQGCTFMRVAFFVGMREVVYTRAFEAHRGFIRPQIWTAWEWYKNSLKMRFEGEAANGKNCQFLRGGYSGGYSNWIFIFEKVDIQNSCQAPPCGDIATIQKKGDWYKKLTLCEQLLNVPILRKLLCIQGFSAKI